MAKAPDWNGSDSEGRKRGEQTVLGQNPIQTNPGLDKLLFQKSSLQSKTVSEKIM